MFLAGIALATAMWVAAVQAEAEQITQPALRIAVLPFVDAAGFQGDWQLSEDVPRRLAAHLALTQGIEVVPPDRVFALFDSLSGGANTQKALKAGRLLGANLVVWGRVEECGVRRMTAGDPNLASYKSYHYRVELDEVELIRVGQQDVWRTLTAQQDTVLRPVEMNLFGKPGELDRQYRELFNVEFGSDAFLQLGFGAFVDGVLQELTTDLVATITDRPRLDTSRAGAEVLSVDSGMVFLGLGTEDGLAVDDVLPLLNSGERVAVVVVTELIGARLSKARILQSTGTVEAGCRIGQRLPPTAATD